MTQNKDTHELTEAKLFTDGGARGNPGPAAYAFVICKMDDTVVEKSGEYIGETTNNQAEYKGLVAGLERCAVMGIKKLNVFMDSELVVKQVNGLYKVKNPDMIGFHQKVAQLKPKFEQISFTHVLRQLNKKADAEVNRVLDSQ